MANDKLKDAMAVIEEIGKEHGTRKAFKHVRAIYDISQKQAVAMIAAPLSTIQAWESSKKSEPPMVAVWCLYYAALLDVQK